MLALALFTATVAQAGDTTVFRGGAVYTLDAAHPWASALVVVDGRIAYVGNDAGAKPYERSAGLDPATQRARIGGRRSDFAR